ncbi:DegT/DnrJ/EryC1/StrS family aminotransferase [Bradyrhizobium canariense]|uniref:Erythromycin biosynthesis sensory transduction protein eryC1 n=1 Tax=Bradyrhizobium canariense TaxID=255045 RepID=A0A1X3H460_9BRAD|nr:DegT/DnrJ/EryC1/StrS family aminotransferase [Bradyrhizobium canariense]OSI69465.1 erythromycin biosynthesis sensory transduction protein eryC1 [Bradyrhizobium canariense]OSI78276.1 erythromycin biosynthesis sensory transduction protein eryC1 [Bradyrhizobium canariense]OSI90221.1 erythromycin biosynthesis sensory transduction protein eryC1 [Bradyrhizobium canariense]OSI93570.1 erythromycin biosynthesis sensory transduction protein eryC1 [Bradyrhizobium canariense]OSJ03546.1 erythromycin bio
MAVPFADLQLQYQNIKGEIDAAVAAVIRDNAFIRGNYVDAFERDFAKAASVAHCVSCANGTDALYLAMAALKVKPGDEVITTAHSWISTSAMITHAGATVRFCDTDGATFTIGPAAIEAAITARTVGIIPVHLYGQPAEMDAIMAIAKKHGLWVIEDCAQAHLARYKGQMVGTFGAAATYSFYPGKNLGAMGDAGAIVTNDADLAEHMTMLARHGGLVKHQHNIEGINSRLDGIQAAILSAKLPYLADWTRARQEAAEIYDAGLDPIEEVEVPRVAPGRDHVYHLYTIKHPRRDALAKHLSTKGIQTAINYPTALPLLPAYRRCGHSPSQFPNASADQSSILSLPMFAEITRGQQEDVVRAIREF